jgi:CRISPR system Cascade subunit CasD
MAGFLLFTLAAPLASFGTVAVGERRPTWDRPSKSQIIGLVAGALGIERQDEPQQERLAASLWYAVRVDDPGQLATDYHTTQVPPARRNRHFSTRVDELAVPKPELKTILSRREFRNGSLSTICLWARLGVAVDLGEIESALRFPVFVPFAGRKAHPLTLPMRPSLVEAPAVETAFAEYDANTSDLIQQLWSDIRLAVGGYRPIYIDADAARAMNLAIDRVEERRDIPESRAKWRFGLRAEALLRQRGPT